MFSITLEQFHGSLDLLLQLIEKDDLDISEVALADVTEKYLDYVEQIDESRTEEIANFLVVAARLVYMKSRLLLPDEEDDEGGDTSLEDQLRAYKRFVDAAHELERRYADNRVIFFRYAPARTGEFVPPKKMSVSVLEHVMRQIVVMHTKRQKATKTTMAVQAIISLEESITRIRGALKAGRPIRFHELLGRRANRAESVVHFLALLELVKQEQVQLRQKALFRDIEIVGAKSN